MAWLACSSTHALQWKQNLDTIANTVAYLHPNESKLLRADLQLASCSTFAQAWKHRKARTGTSTPLAIAIMSIGTHAYRCAQIPLRIPCPEGAHQGKAHAPRLHLEAGVSVCCYGCNDHTGTLNPGGLAPNSLWCGHGMTMARNTVCTCQSTLRLGAASLQAADTAREAAALLGELLQWLGRLRTCMRFADEQQCGEPRVRIMHSI
jgi:hypothetical protein